MTEKGVAFNPPLGNGEIAFNTNDYKNENSDILTLKTANERYAKDGETFIHFTNIEDVEVSIGEDSNNNQEINSISIGRNSAGGGEPVVNPQRQNTICIGTNSGLGNSDFSISIGRDTGGTQLTKAIAVGKEAGRDQSTSCIALGLLAGRDQDSNAIAIGRNSGSNQSTSSIAIGNNATDNGIQNAYSIAIGQEASRNGIGLQGISIGNESNYRGNDSEINNICIGNECGSASSNKDYRVLIGNQVGKDGGLGTYTTAIGDQAGLNGSSAAIIAVGYKSGGGDATSTAGKGRSIAIGSEAQAICDDTLDAKNKRNIGIGYRAARTHQYEGSIGIGHKAQETASNAFGNQSQFSVALGANAAQASQGFASTAIGYKAQQSNSGNYCLGIGYFAGNSSQPNDTIVINNSGSQFNGGSADRFYIKNMRSVSNLFGLNELRYNDFTKEVHYND